MADSLPQHQRHTGTVAGRHLALMQDVRAHFLQDGRPLAGMHLLSFGCSSGEECSDLASVFPEARVYGAEIDRVQLQAARQRSTRRLRVFHATEANLLAHAPYGAIFALNVLCRTPATMGMANVAALYPFAQFNQTVTLLDSLLRPGGILALYNAQYFLEDTTPGSGYAALPQPSFSGSGWVEKCAPTGERVARVLFRHDGQEYPWPEWNRFVKESPEARGPKHGRYRQEWLAGRGEGGQHLGTSIWRKAR